jgi:Tol biopolymer transport system component
MGQVYRGRDTRLNRSVAIKFLSAEGADAGARDRFRREAQTASSLNHPNILTVHDVGAYEDREYLVSELVEGGTLRDWAAREQRSWRQILELLIGVADGLAEAHAAGIIHRDIKPENILVARNALAKLGDFGLAKLLDPSTSTGETRETRVRTRTGLVVGTIAYMSPEQSLGKQLDARSDIFSFGVVLYELLTGRLPIEGSFGSRSHIPEPLRRIVEKSLAKDPVERYQTMRDLVVDLRHLLRETDHKVPQRRMMPVYTAAALVLVLVAAAVVVLVTRQTNDRPASPIRLEPITAFTDAAIQPSVSSDGRMLTFIRGSSNLTGAGQVYVKMLPDGEPIQLTHDTANKGIPTFSPDGTHIVYTVTTNSNGWDTWMVPVLGGEPKLWLPNASGLRWTGPGEVLFSEIKTGFHMAIVASPENRIGSRDVYVPVSIRGMAHRSYLSPDRQNILVAEMENAGMIACRIVPFDGSSPGHVVGPPTGQCTHAQWSPDGRSMYFTSSASGSFQVWRQSYPDGKPVQLTQGPTEAEGLAMFPDGKSLVTSVGLSQWAVSFVDASGQHQISTEGDAMFPAWGDGFPTSVFSPDGSKLYYLARGGAAARGFANGELWVADLATQTKERALSGVQMNTYDISNDGQRVVYASFDGADKSKIWVARLDRRAAPVMLPPAEARGPVFGRENDVYYRGSEDDRWFIYRLSLDSQESRKFIEDEAVNSPVISPDGRWLLSLVPFATDDATTMLKAFRTDPTEPPRVICPRCYVSWSRDQRNFYLSFVPPNGTSGGSTFVFSLEPGQALPNLPAAGVRNEAEIRKLPGVRVIAHPDHPGFFQERRKIPTPSSVCS